MHLLRSALVVTLLLAPSLATAQVTDTTNPTETNLRAGAPVDSGTVGTATRDTPSKFVGDTTSATPPRAQAAKKTDKKADAGKDPFARPVYIVRHTLMGVTVGVLGAAALVALIAGPTLLLLPEGLPFENLFPQRWRQASGAVLLAGVLPGLLLGVVGGIAVTAISAFQNRGALSE